MNWVDALVLIVLAVSALMAFARGLVRELLGIGAWVGAGLFAAWFSPLVRGHFRDWIGHTEVADVCAYLGMFFVALIVLSVIASTIGNLVRVSALSSIDRTLGVVFGLLRGAALIVAAYILVGMALPVEQWPTVVQEARALPYAFDGALLAVELLPAEFRPTVHAPPVPRPTRAEDLLRAAPTGRAVARP